MQYLFFAIVLYLFYQYMNKNKPRIKGNQNRKKETVIDIEPEDYSVELVPLPYKKVSELLSASESAFFLILKQLLSEKDFYIFAKVRVSEILVVPNNISERIVYSNKTQAKHIDFLLCDKDNYSPLLAIKFDDATTNSLESQKGEDFVNRAFAAAGLPLIRIKARLDYSLEDLQHILQPYI